METPTKIQKEFSENRKEIYNGDVLVLIPVYVVRKHAVDWRKPLKSELQTTVDAYAYSFAA